ncbi:hypothetical protein [Cyanobacterium sp. Dongsha4]|uniref:hypothetical protein n=1 Tax=Cyanobacterium sp. DS4 TaxID=2878255 RepID=UPI002E820F69|nr:hypothetical protein [Cyanobacterium sp. Dongsha4]WVL00297.1 hypothetical protein Dongsha4_16840 [Cyanobacterium sp. Dongsha4]
MMEKQQDILGYVGLGVSAVGAIASLIIPSPTNVAVASAGLTVGVGCNVFSRKQQYESIVDAYNQQQETINELTQKIEANHAELNQTLMDYKADLGTSMEKLQQSIQELLNSQKEEIAQEVKRLDIQHQELNNVVLNMKEVENLSQELRSHSDSADFFYQRGVGYEKLGNISGAIEDYTEAIKRDGNMAKAYHKRGVLYLDSNMKQKAVDDLRKAALLYFEQGDIDSYHQAREMSRNIHDLKVEANGKATEMVVGSELFS